MTAVVTELVSLWGTKDRYRVVEKGIFVLLENSLDVRSAKSLCEFQPTFGVGVNLTNPTDGILPRQRNLAGSSVDNTKLVLPFSSQAEAQEVADRINNQATLMK